MEEQLANLQFLIVAGGIIGFLLTGWTGLIQYRFAEQRRDTKRLETALTALGESSKKDLKDQGESLRAFLKTIEDAYKKSIGRLWEKWDEHQKTYAKDRLADAKEFASRSEMTAAVNKLDSDLKDMERRIGDNVGAMKTEIKADIHELAKKVDKALELRANA